LYLLLVHQLRSSSPLSAALEATNGNPCGLPAALSVLDIPPVCLVLAPCSRLRLLADRYRYLTSYLPVGALVVVVSILACLLLSVPAAAGEPSLSPEQLLADATAHVRLGYYEDSLQLVRRAGDARQSEGMASIAELVEARANLGLGRSAEARGGFSRHMKSDRAGLALFATFYMAMVEADEGNSTAGLKLLEQVKEHPLAWALEPRLTIHGIELAIRSGEKKPVGRWLKRLKHQKGVEKSVRLVHTINALQVLEAEVDAKCAALHQEYPCARLPAPCAGLDLAGRMSPRERFLRAERLFDCWGYEESAREFEHFLDAREFRKFRNRSHFYLAEIHARKLRDDRETAFKHYKHVFEQGGGRRSYALYHMGRCKMNLEKYNEARKLFERYIKRYPDGEFAERCHYYAGWLPYDHDELAQALPGFDRFLGKYNKSSLRSYILWFKAWSLYRLKRHEDAAEALEPLLGYGNDIVAGKAYYWLGKTHLRLKKSEAARAWFKKVFDRYPLSYYGLLAWREMERMEQGTVEHPLFSGTLPELPYPSPSQWRSYVPQKMAGRFQPIMDAIHLGEVKAARALFAREEKAFDRANRNRAADAGYWILSLLEEPSKMRKWGRKNRRMHGKAPNKKNRLGWMFEYPLAYWPLIRVEAAKAGLPPLFLCSIMRQESRYRRGVISWADAVGLLQVIPKTGAETADRLGIEFRRQRLAEPEYNIKLGAAYLGFLARDFRNQFILVAASYNAGPNAVRTFLKANRDEELDFAVEEIAYNEARNYCRKVSGHLLKYLAIYVPVDDRKGIVEKLLPAEVNFDVGNTTVY